MKNGTKKQRPTQEDGHFEARGFLLKKQWQRIMGKKMWATYTEESLEKATAAWAWLQYFVKEKQSGQNGYEWRGIEFGIFSKLARKHSILWRKGFDAPVFCLGNASLAVLVWPLSRFQSGDVVENDVEYYCLDSKQQSLDVFG